MRWTIACAGCGQAVRARDRHQGQALQCPVCERPLPAGPPPPTAPPFSLRLLRAALRRRWPIAGVAAAAVVVAAVVLARGLSGNRPPDPPPQARLGAEPHPPGPGWPGRWREGGRGGPFPPGGPWGGPWWPRRRPPGEAWPWREENLLAVPDELDFPLPRPSPGREASLPLAGRVAPCLALAADARSKRLLTCDSSGELRWYDLPTLRPLGSCRLEQPAYHMVVCPEQRSLITASASPETLSLGPVGDLEHAVGDLHAYDLDALFRQPAGQAARPARSLALGAYVSGLALAPGGERVYYLAESGRDAHVAEVDAGRLERKQRHWLRAGGAAALALAPDAAVLYAASAGRIVGLDLRTWKETTTVVVSGTTYGLAAGRGGKVYLADRRPGLQVLVVDMRRREALARWQSDLEGRTYLLPAQGSDRLFVGTSAVVAGCVLELDVAGARAVHPAVAASAEGDRRRLLRGPVFLTPGGEYVVTGSGLVFRAGKSG